MRSRSLLLVSLVASGGVLYALPSTSLLYLGLVLFHVAAGLVLTVVLLRMLWRRLTDASLQSHLGWYLLALGAVTGIILIFTGTPRPYLPLLYAHIAVSLGGLVLLAGEWMARRWRGSGRRSGAVAAAALALVAVLASAAAHYQRGHGWLASYRIENPAMPPDSMDGEGAGPSGPFFPSSVQTTDGRPVPSKFFMRSDTCQRCHSDIYDQWFSSAHHFSSFNNQWYRKSIEYMQEVVGTQPSKWCGGCHDPAILMTGMMDTPIKEIIDRPEAHAGLGCMACHSIVQVGSSMGQGDFMIDYPRMHDMAASDKPVVRWIHDFLVMLNPEPHRRAFMKPFMREQTAEFCSSCHKVHLDEPVNAYRWIRGFNEYDNWQGSGVSGQGARAFYYPPKPQKCADCHMPLVASNDFGNRGGKVKSHRFPGANTALPLVNEDWEQLRITKEFLQDDIVTVDIFALSPAQPQAIASGYQRHEMATTFAVGEEAEMLLPAVVDQEVLPLTAPLNRVQPVVRRGDTHRVNVVVRTRKVGHFFPGGTVDAFDVWVELKAVDEKGQILFWSGKVEDDGKGPVEKGAHFYRSLMMDGHGNPINKRNAWANRALVYVRLIPPGAADTVHYRLHIPENAGETITLTAKLHYRKFAWWNTQWAFAGVRDPERPGIVAADYDNWPFIFTGDTSSVSGKFKGIPDVPIVTLASDEVTLRVAPGGTDVPEPRLDLRAEDWERWNDYGIGLFLQGDLRGAERAFRKATELDPQHPDGWVNIGRVRVQEGDTAGAREVLERALQLAPDIARAHFFYGRALRQDGEYDRALQHQRKAIAQYPRDRVVRNEIGRVLFLQRRYAEAIAEFQQTLKIDPEDLAAHYNLMLSYNGLGNEEMALRHQARYLRFKADESAQALTGEYRRLNPADNNERQAIHEHESIPLAPLAAPRPQRAAVPARTQYSGTDD